MENSFSLIIRFPFCLLSSVDCIFICIHSTLHSLDRIFVVVSINENIKLCRDDVYITKDVLINIEKVHYFQ